MCRGGDGYWSMCGRGTSREEAAKSAPGDQLVAEEELISKHVRFCVLAKFLNKIDSSSSNTVF